MDLNEMVGLVYSYLDMGLWLWTIMRVHMLYWLKCDVMSLYKYQTVWS